MLSVGDSWTIHYQTDYNAPEGFRHVVGLATLRPPGGTDVSTVKETYGEGYDEGSVRSITTSWYSVDSHALVRESMSGDGWTTDTWYDPPCPEYRWPLQVGQEIEFTCESTTTSTRAGQPPSTSTHEKKTRYSVEALENVTVAAGTFQAYRIGLWDTDYMDGEAKGSDGWQRHEWYAPAVCSWVKRAHNFMGDVDTIAAYACHEPGRPA